MSLNLNKVTVAGRLGQDPELRKLPSGSEIVNISVATTRKWKQDNQQKEETEWHRIVAFGKTAENIAKYFSKGSAIYIEGRLKTSSWDDKETGKKLYKTEILADRFEFVESKASQENAGHVQYDEPRESGVPDTDDSISPDDIPF